MKYADRQPVSTITFLELCSLALAAVIVSLYMHKPQGFEEGAPKRPGTKVFTAHINPPILILPNDQYAAFSVSLDTTTNKCLESARSYATIDLKSLQLRQPPVGLQPNISTQKVVGFSNNHEVVVVRQINGTRDLQHVESIFRSNMKLQILICSLDGKERILHTYSVPAFAAFYSPKATSGILSCFTMTIDRRALLFTDAGTGYTRQGMLIRRGVPLYNADLLKNVATIHRLSLATGKDEMVGSLPPGWHGYRLSARQVSESAPIDITALAVQYTLKGRRPYAVFRGSGGRLKKLPISLQPGAVGNEFSPQGTRLARIILTKGSGWGPGDYALQIVSLESNYPMLSVNLHNESSIPLIAWNKTGNKVLISPFVSYSGEQLRIVYLPSGQLRPIGPKLHGNIVAAWTQNDKGIIDIVNHTVRYIDVDSGKSHIITRLKGMSAGWG